MRDLTNFKPEGKRNWYTRGELALLLGIDESTVKRRVRAGKLPKPESATARGWHLWSPVQIRGILGQD